jgi:hypothetical protein
MQSFKNEAEIDIVSLSLSFLATIYYKMSIKNNIKLAKQKCFEKINSLLLYLIMIF